MLFKRLHGPSYLTREEKSLLEIYHVMAGQQWTFSDDKDYTSSEWIDNLCKAIKELEQKQGKLEGRTIFSLEEEYSQLSGKEPPSIIPYNAETRYQRDEKLIEEIRRLRKEKGLPDLPENLPIIENRNTAGKRAYYKVTGRAFQDDFPYDESIYPTGEAWIDKMYEVVAQLKAERGIK